MSDNRIDITSQKFGRLTAIRFIESKQGQSRWLFDCECGKQTITSSQRVKKGHTKSCGCIRIERRKLAEGEAARNIVYRQYKIDAKKRNLEFNLNIDEFEKLTKGNCFFCGIEPSTTQTLNINTKNSSNYIYNGIDRINNNIGYIYSNCASCCYDCNQAKWTRSVEEFLEWAHRLSDYQNGER